MVDLRDPGLLVQVKLQQLFKINFRIAAHVDEYHNFGPVLHHLVESIFGAAPESLTYRGRIHSSGICQGGLAHRRRFGLGKWA